MMTKSILARCIAFLFTTMTSAHLLSTPIYAQSEHHKPAGSLLGTHTRLVLSCKDIIQSMLWWTKLGFNPAPGVASAPDSAMSLTDGHITITLVNVSLPSPIVMFGSSRIKDLKDTMAANNINTTFDVKGPTYGEIRLLSPNGIYVAVRPAPDEHSFLFKEHDNIICGKNTELSIGTSFLRKEQDYWELLGFTVKRSGTIPYPYALMTDGSLTIGLHENRDIPTLSITYFAEDMIDRIDRIRKMGIEVTEELEDPSGKTANGRLVSPDGQVVFLFKGNQ